MKICAISDLHGKFKEVKIEPVDILFICGDIVPLSIQRSIPLSFEWYVINFIKWCQEQPAKQIYFVPGNHDFFLQNNEIKAKKLLQGTNITVLYNEGAEYFDEVSEKYIQFGVLLIVIYLEIGHLCIQRKRIKKTSN